MGSFTRDEIEQAFGVYQDAAADEFAFDVVSSQFCHRQIW